MVWLYLHLLRPQAIAMPGESYCPYCNNIRSLLLGHVYCSRQGAAMAELETGTLFIKAKKLEETGDHVSRLSIRCNLTGEQRYKVGGNDCLVKPTNFLVVNQGQHYKTSFEAEEEQEMILVAFKPGFAESLFYALSRNTAQLLNSPFGTCSDQLHFFEKTYEEDAVIKRLFLRLRSIIDLEDDVKRTLDIDAVYTALLERLIRLQGSVQKEVDSLHHLRASTRAELHRRLHIARDFMEAHVGEKVSLDTIATTACLSVHHFKREFKSLFGESPHRYLSLKRMEKAKQLLRSGRLSIEEVGAECGFENESSFIRQFKRYAGATPGQHRQSERRRTLLKTSV